MARTLQQILTELSPQYNPQIKNVRARQAEIPGMIAAEEQGLQAKQTQAFDDITSGARRRGLGFSGIPLAEQAKYTSTEYLPALARLRQSGREQAMSLEDAILGIQERRGTLAQQLRQQGLDRDEQRRQFDASLAANERASRRAAAASAAAMPSLGALMGGGGAGPAPKASFTKEQGWQFSSAAGQPITAAQYAKASATDLGDLLYEMGKRGDVKAASLYNQLQVASRGSKKDYDAVFKSYQKMVPWILGGV